ncbi:MAG: (2Fe-2S) ferredoxin domain-containing protein, partial [Deltaproteobacteria bacterium]|nr:(2Fe-2S) ferredoxin domain-containing protein [Deltaproteobacteria bacterium]
MKTLRIGYNSCGIAAGAEETLAKLESLVAGKPAFKIVKTGCNGMCFIEPIVDVIDNGKVFTYGNLTADKVE